MRRTVKFCADLLVEGVETRDHRYITPGSTLWTKAPPLVVRALTTGPRPVGVILKLWRHEKRICCTGTLRMTWRERWAVRRGDFVLGADCGAGSVELDDDALILNAPDVIGATLIPTDLAPWPDMRLWLTRDSTSGPGGR